MRKNYMWSDEHFSCHWPVHWPLFQIISVFLLIGMFTGTSMALATTVPEICTRDKGTYIIRCAKTCAPACLDKMFKYASRAHYNKCQQLSQMSRKRDEGGRLCLHRKKRSANNKIRRLSYQECKKKVADYFRRHGTKPPPEGPLKQVLSSRPSCATPIRKLLARFFCMRGAADKVSRGLDQIRKVGFGNADAERICSLPDGEYKTYSKVAKGLIEKGEALSRDFGDLESCRQGLEGWFPQLSQACNGTSFKNCKIIVAQFQGQIGPKLKSMASLAQETKSVLDRLKKERNAIRISYSFRENCGANDDSFDDIFGK